ncbi:MAG: O-methyltransferase [Cyclonatronaceae bacterium]
MISLQDASNYARELMRKEPSLLVELRGTTARELRHDDMLSGPVVGAFLHLLVRVSAARTVLEIGTFTGYATLWMAMGLSSGGKVYTCESNEKYAGIARRYFRRFEEGWEKNKGTEKTGGRPPDIELLAGEALKVRLPERADFIFLDADKERYPDYYRHLFPLLAPGGLMVIDNAFWGGKVWTDPKLADGREKDSKTRSVDELNRMIADDPLVENVILCVRDGLHLVRKTQDY